MGSTNVVEISMESVETPVWLGSVEPFLLSAMSLLGMTESEVSVVFCSDSFIRELNRMYRGKDEPTDVLSFSQIEGDGIPGGLVSGTCAGDIVVSLDSLAGNAREFQVPADEELARLLLHGLLHLAGMDHASNHKDEPMLQRQEQLLKTLKGEKPFFL